MKVKTKAIDAFLKQDYQMVRDRLVDEAIEEWDEEEGEGLCFPVYIIERVSEKWQEYIMSN